MASLRTFSKDWIYTIPENLNTPKTEDPGFYITLKNLIPKMKLSIEKFSLRVLMVIVG
jgi:hypothetical protein